MTVAAILTAVTLFLSIFCLIQAAFVNPLLALPAVLSIAGLLVCSYIAVAAHKKKKVIEEKIKNKNRNRI